MKVDGIVYWIFEWGVNARDGRDIGDVLDSGVCDEVGEGFEL